MTSTTTDTGRRVYVRRRGYAELLEVHGDHSASVRYEGSAIHDGCDHPAADGAERVSFGDWSYDRTGLDTTTIEVKERIRTALQLDFGQEDFAVASSGIGPGDASWFEAHFGPHMIVKVTVTPVARQVGMSAEQPGNPDCEVCGNYCGSDGVCGSDGCTCAESVRAYMANR
jgi:hypothetical protein